MNLSGKIPPIQYLTVFEAAARHLSFRAASEELHITPSAVSQQIKSLENILGLLLFNRTTRKIVLTSAGRNFFDVAAKTLNTYRGGILKFKHQYCSHILKLSMTAYVAYEMVIPKLHDFSNAYTDIDLVLQTCTNVESLNENDIDAAIRFGVPPWRGSDVRLISDAKANLVASTDYLKKNPLNSLDELNNHTLIHFRSTVDDWQYAMDTIGFQFIPKHQLFFDSYMAAIKAAQEGLGIAIGLFPIINMKIRSGDLITLLPENLDIKEGFYLVTQPYDTKRGLYSKLEVWLKDVFLHHSSY